MDPFVGKVDFHAVDVGDLNLSSSRALRDVTRAHGCDYSAAAVGEVNVVTEMKRTGAIIGGEGNGGVIYPELHYGRDALVGVALFLTLMAKSGKNSRSVGEDIVGHGDESVFFNEHASVFHDDGETVDVGVDDKYPPYAIAKHKIELTPDIDVDAILEAVKQKFAGEEITDIDGVKIDFADKSMSMRARRQCC